MWSVCGPADWVGEFPCHLVQFIKLFISLDQLHKIPSSKSQSHGVGGTVGASIGGSVGVTCVEQGESSMSKSSIPMSPRNRKSHEWIPGRICVDAV